MKKRSFATAICTAGFCLIFTQLFSKGTDRKFIIYERFLPETFCDVELTGLAGRRASLKVLVSFVHFEEERMSACELANKRNNLAFFLLSAVSTSSPNVHFALTFPGRKPEPSDILTSAGILPESSSGKVVTDLLTNREENVELLGSSVNQSAADLCHHHGVISEHIRAGRFYDYVLILNDGARGPFFINSDKLSELVWP